MASLRKLNGKWLVEVRIKGHPHRSKTFAIKHDAQAWALEQERAMGRHGHIAVGKTLRQAMQRYSDEVSPTRRGCRWEQVRLTKLQRDPLADIVLDMLTPDDLQGWIKRQTIGPGSIRRELNLLQAVLRTARHQWKWLRHNPFEGIERPPAPAPRDRRISDAENATVLAWLGYDEASEVKTARQHLAVAFLFAMETAMRQGEIWAMRWEDVYLEKRFVTLPLTKNGSRRDVSLSTRAVELLGKIPGERTGAVFKTNQASASATFTKLAKEKGLTGLTFHTTRHEAITRLARKLDILDLARMVGHQDLKSLRIYYNPTAQEIAERLG